MRKVQRITNMKTAKRNPEELWPIQDIEDRFPQLKAKVATVAYWIKSGIKVDGTPVKLSAARIGHRLYTTDAAMGEFVKATNGGLDVGLLKM